MRKTLQYMDVAADAGYNLSDFVESLESALTHFGLVVVEDPRYEGSDMIGVLICNRKPTKTELDEIVEEGP
jgi:hypothetical protein